MSHAAYHRKDRDTLRLTQSVVNNVSEAGPLPFELRVLEALLDETARQFERRQRRLFVGATFTPCEKAFGS